jgi:GcrA cell cycle regulator
MADPREFWPEADCDLLRILALKGGSAGQIALELYDETGARRSRSSVIAKIHRMKIVWKSTREFGGSANSTPKLARIRRARAVSEKPWKTPPVKPPRPVTIKTCAGIVPKGIRCVDLEDGHCRWPYGEGIITFCGHERVKDEPYCLPHLHLSRGEGTRSEREAVSV